MVVVFYEKMLRRVLVLICCLGLFSCSGDRVEIKTYESGFNLNKTSFSNLNKWHKDDLYLFDKTIKSVCTKVLATKGDTIKSGFFEYSLSDYKKHCLNIAKIDNRTELKNYIEQNFDPYAVVYNGNEFGKFTSYYEAEIRASFYNNDKYKYPIYGKPNDLIEFNLADFDASLPSKRFVGRVKDGKLVKYYTRKEIEVDGIDAPVILWGDNIVDIYLMQIQGAAMATLPDGRKIRVGYVDNNGHAFKGIGSILLNKGLIKPQDASMDKIRVWLNKKGKTALENMQLNNRFIFHKLVDADGPIGAMGLPLYAGRSMAVDREFIPLGTILWLETDSPAGSLNKLVVAEDVGSAIKGAVRGDYFWGSGEEALKYAGKMNAKGKYFVVLPKKSKVVVYGR